MGQKDTYDEALIVEQLHHQETVNAAFGKVIEQHWQFPWRGQVFDMALQDCSERKHHLHQQEKGAKQHLARRRFVVLDQQP